MSAAPFQYTSSQVANAFIARAKGKLAHLALQKLLFFMHCWSLALHGKSCLVQRPQAWTHGPVFATLYHELKHMGTDRIRHQLTEYDRTLDEVVAFMPSQSDKAFWTLFEQVWDRYAHFDALQLSALAHTSDGPWAQARAAALLDIPDDWCLSHYRAKLQAPAEDPPPAPTSTRAARPNLVRVK